MKTKVRNQDNIIELDLILSQKDIFDIMKNACQDEEDEFIFKLDRLIKKEVKYRT